jgi:hypothetical protein
MLDGGRGDAFFERGGKCFNHHNGFGTGVLELVLQLTRCVQRVDIHHHQACTQNAGHYHRVLGHIEHHDGDAIALDQTQTLQIRSERLAQTVRLGVGDVLAHKAVGHLARILAETVFHQIHQRCVLAGVDFRRNSRWVALEPNAICHVISIIFCCTQTYFPSADPLKKLCFP